MLTYHIKAKALVPASDLPVGTVAMFDGQGPEGWIPCDGRYLPRASFRDLAEVIGDSYAPPLIPAQGRWNGFLRWLGFYPTRENPDYRLGFIRLPNMLATTVLADNWGGPTHGEEAALFTNPAPRLPPMPPAQRRYTTSGSAARLYDESARSHDDTVSMLATVAVLDAVTSDYTPAYDPNPACDYSPSYDSGSSYDSCDTGSSWSGD